MDIRNELEQLRDEKYREFGLSLLPNVDKSKMIGVRLPQLRAVAARSPCSSSMRRKRHGSISKIIVSTISLSTSRFRR